MPHDHDPSHQAHGAFDTNAAVWKDPATAAQWAAETAEREKRRGWPRALVAELLPFNQGDTFTFADLGAGTGVGAAAVLARYPNAHAVLVEFSPQMAAEGRTALSEYEGRYRYLEVDIASGVWPDELSGGLHAVTTSLFVHHLPDLRKRALFAEVRERLVPGGWFYDYDQVTAPDPSVQSAWERTIDARDPEAAARRAQRTPQEQARYENHVRYLGPLAPQISFLHEAGFEAVDVYWKELDQVILGGRNPSD